ncbi:phage portal protein [Prauserella flavalba]|uniref:phage portal protein n=1 Tax=Prauserella flavalba TaxID=1477506 RepID=UPI0036EB790D
MGLGKLFTRAVPAVPIEHRMAGETFAALLREHGGVNAMHGYRGAMSIPGAWRSVLLIADLLGSVPWNAYRQRAGRPLELLTPTPPLLEQPAPYEPRMSTLSSWAMDLVWHGNAIGLIADRNADGYPTAVLPIPADNASARRANGSDASPVPHGRIEYLIGGRTFDEFDVLHIKGPHRPGAVRGFGVLEAHLSAPTNALALAQELARQAANVSRSGVPTGILRSTNPDATEDDLKETKARWLANQRDRTVSVLNASTEFTPLAWNPEEMQLVEARKFALHEIALIFGLPLSFLGVEQSSRTYTNVEQEAINLLKFTLGGHLARFEQTLSQQFPRGTTVKANLDAILRADTLTRYRSHQIGLTAGFLAPDEVRDLEDRPPLTVEQKADIAAAKAAARPAPPERADDDPEAEPEQEDTP